jgi:hypothetical protein
MWLGVRNFMVRLSGGVRIVCKKAAVENSDIFTEDARE